MNCEICGDLLDEEEELEEICRNCQSSILQDDGINIL